tara:strand:+ start:1508 stop:1957 length:450 start_codon:yes stop_codon:yes gene_type:complete
LKKIKLFTIYFLGIFYLNVGITHFTNPDFFLVIIPPYIPYSEFFVYLSGLFEALFGLMIIFKKTRFYGAWGIFFLLLAVFPANIYLYTSYEAQELLSITKEGSFIRLFYQIPLLILAYWHSLEKSSCKMDIFASAIFFPTIIYFLTLTS